MNEGAGIQTQSLHELRAKVLSFSTVPQTLRPSIFSATKTIPTVFIFEGFPNYKCSLLETALQSRELVEIIRECETLKSLTPMFSDKAYFIEN